MRIESPRHRTGRLASTDDDRAPARHRRQVSSDKMPGLSSLDYGVEEMVQQADSGAWRANR